MATVTHTFVSGIADDPTAAAAGEVLPSHWNANHTVSGVRTILTANTNYYITVTGSDANDGSLAHPWATLQHACDFIAENLDLAGFQVTINIGAGSFAGAGAKSTVGGGIVYVLGAGTASTTIISGPNDGVFNFGECLCFNVLNGSSWYIQEMAFLGVSVDNGAQIGIFVPAISLSIGQPGGAVGGNFKSASSVAITNPGFVFSLFQIELEHTVSSLAFDRTHTTGNLLTEYEIGEGGVVGFNGVTITITGAPTYSSTGGFFLLYSDSMLVGGSLTINGAFTGPAGLISFGSSINFDITVTNGNTFILDNSGVLPDSSAAFASPGYQQLAGAPTTSNLPKPTHGVFKDTNYSGTPSLGLALYANDGGTIVEITRQKLTANTNFYVATTGNDSNPGTLASPWATLTHAFTFISENLDGSGTFNVIVNVGAGSFAGGALRYNVGVPIVQVNGAGSTSTTITAGPNDGVFNFGECFDNPVGYTTFGINKVKIVPSGGAPGIANYQIGTEVGCGTDFTGTTLPDIAYNCTSATFVILRAAPGLIVDCNDATVTIGVVGGGATLEAFLRVESDTPASVGASYAISGSLAVTSGFLEATNVGVFSTGAGGANTFTGAGVTGPRFNCNGASSIGSVNGSGALGPNFFPGNSAGVCDASSTYDGFPGPLPGIDTQTGASYTLAIGDAFKIVEMNNAGANTLTVPLNATVAFEIGTKIWVTQIGAGATTIAGAGGVTVDNVGVVGGQWKSVKLYKRGTDEWVQTNA